VEHQADVHDSDANDVHVHEHCCHDHAPEGPNRSIAGTSSQSPESMRSGARLCEGCEHWSSITQASQAWITADCISEDRLGAFALDRALSFLGDTLVAWNSRGPPVCC
jgi:hypothetical protein